MIHSVASESQKGLWQCHKNNGLIPLLKIGDFWQKLHWGYIYPPPPVAGTRDKLRWLWRIFSSIYVHSPLTDKMRRYNKKAVLSQKWPSDGLVPIYGCPENFRHSLTTPTAILFPILFMAFCSDRPCEVWMCVQHYFEVRSFTRSVRVAYFSRTNCQAKEADGVSVHKFVS